MDEALLTGRFNVYPDMTRRSMSAKSSRISSASTANPQAERNTPTRPQSVGRRNSRADTCLRRSRSAFDVELFKRQLRLNKSLSRNRFKQEALDIAVLHDSARAGSHARGDSARAVWGQRMEPEGSEVDAIVGSVRPSSENEEGVGQREKTHVPPALDSDEENQTKTLSKPLVADTKKKDEDKDEIKVNFNNDNNKATLNGEGALATRDHVLSDDPRVDKPAEGELPFESSEDHRAVTSRESPPPSLTPTDASTKEPAGRRRRRRRPESRQKVLTTHGAGPRKDRRDGAIVINPQRNKIRFDISHELISPRRFSPPPVLVSARTNTSSSSGLFYVDSSSACSSDSSSADEELIGLIGHTPSVHQGRRSRKSKRSSRRSRKRTGDGGDTEDVEDSGLSTSGKPGDSERMFYVYESGSEKYDTDFEVEEGSDFRIKERNQSTSCLDADFGHLTYEAACAKFKVVPRRRIIHQLTTRRLQINYCGLSEQEAKALALGLRHNHRLDEVDLASNGMTGQSIAHIANCFNENIFITKLNLGGNNIEEEGATALSEMLKSNVWVTHLNLSDCGISDNEIGFLSKGLQENNTVVCLNLSKNKMHMQGGRHLATVLGHNKGLECLNLSWNVLRGAGAVAVCNSLHRNHTLQELNLSWNGLGFQGSLAISEALKVNKSITKLDISNNRVDWDCTPFLAKALFLNKTLEVLEMGHNPVSMEGCMKLLEAVDRPSSRLTFLSLADVPINSTIAFKATEISKTREFSLEHGGVITTRDVFGVQRIKREDPFTLLIRYLSTMGIRVVDLFRMFDTTSNLYVSQANFIRGLKRARAPLEEEDMLRVARRLRSDKRGDISYQELAASVRNRIREDRLIDQRLHQLALKKKEQQKRILQSDLPLYLPYTFTYNSAFYDMYGTNVTGRRRPSRIGQESSPTATDGRISREEMDMFNNRRFSRGDLDLMISNRRKFSRADSDLVSRRGSPAVRLRGGGFGRQTPSTAVSASGFMPRIDAKREKLRRQGFGMDKAVDMDVGRTSTPFTLVRHGTKGLPGTHKPLLILGDTPEGKDRTSSTTGDLQEPGLSYSREPSHIPPGTISGVKDIENLPKWALNELGRNSKSEKNRLKEKRSPEQKYFSSSRGSGARQKTLSSGSKQSGPRLKDTRSPKDSSPGSKNLSRGSSKQSGHGAKDSVRCYKDSPYSPKLLPDIHATRSLVGGHREKEAVTPLDGKKAEHLPSPVKDSKVPTARKRIEYFDANRRL